MLPDSLSQIVKESVIILQITLVTTGYLTCGVQSMGNGACGGLPWRREASRVLPEFLLVISRRASEIKKGKANGP